MDIYPALKCVRGCATDEQFQQLSANVEKLLADERERCAKVAENACLVPPDGGCPSAEETEIAAEAARRIRALTT